MYPLRKASPAKSIYFTGILAPTGFHMPGIQMTVFREQVEQLLLAFTRPTDFLRLLRAIFERYGLPAYHAADEKRSLPEPAYHLPALVLREIEIKLPPLCEENPGAALRLSDALVQDRYAEIRLLAGDLLGFTPSSEAAAIQNAISRFCELESSAWMRREWILRSSLSLRRSKGQAWLQWIEQNLKNPESKKQDIGFFALFSVIEDQKFENLPPVFRLLEPFLLSFNREQENLLRKLLGALTARTPTETAYFLAEIAPYAREQRSQRLIRACITPFTMEQQREIRRGLSQAGQIES